MWEEHKSWDTNKKPSQTEFKFVSWITWNHFTTCLNPNVNGKFCYLLDYIYYLYPPSFIYRVAVISRNFLSQIAIVFGFFMYYVKLFTQFNKRTIFIINSVRTKKACRSKVFMWSWNRINNVIWYDTIHSTLYTKMPIITSHHHHDQHGIHITLYTTKCS